MLLPELKQSFGIQTVLENLLCSGGSPLFFTTAGQNKVEFRVENAGVWKILNRLTRWYRLWQGADHCY